MCAGRGGSLTRSAPHCQRAAGGGHAAAGDGSVDGDGGGGDGGGTVATVKIAVAAAVRAKEETTLAVARAVLSVVGEDGMASS